MVPAPPATGVVPNGQPASTTTNGLPVAHHAPPPNGSVSTKSTTIAAPGADPIILALAERAGGDPALRDLMKRVASGDAPKPELDRFQDIIDAITAENKAKGPQPAPSASRLVVDGRTVRYFADEVRAILDIVLTSNPKQTSTNLRPPQGSDPLVVALVKTALDDVKTAETVRRIATDRPTFSDPTDLKALLDRLHNEIARPRAKPGPSAAPLAKNIASTNGQPLQSAGPPTGLVLPPTQQGLRSRGGPAAPPKPDYAAVVFEFAGGNGDRYLFPKFSILEYLPAGAGTAGQQVVASFLVVLKGNKSEYPVMDPNLDYYQPITIRLHSPLGRHLEYLARVVVPQDEVRRYMDDVMETATRGEYVLLAMRLPRGDTQAKQNGEVAESTGAAGETGADAAPNRVSPSLLANANPAAAGASSSPPPPVLWNAKPQKPHVRELPPRARLYKATDDDVQDADYQSFISSVSQKRGRGGPLQP